MRKLGLLLGGILVCQLAALWGLKPEDFTILEDGKPQSIAVFQAVDIPNPEPPATTRRAVAPTS